MSRGVLGSGLRRFAGFFRLRRRFGDEKEVAGDAVELGKQVEGCDFGQGNAHFVIGVGGAGGVQEIRHLLLGKPSVCPQSAEILGELL